MPKSIKAALLSALVFPGLGHLFLKKYVAALLLGGTAFVSIYWLVSRVVERTLKISEKIQSGEAQLDAAAITELVSNQAGGAEAQSLDVATAVIVIVWLVAVVDSYRRGRMQDKRDATDRLLDKFKNIISDELK